MRSETPEIAIELSLQPYRAFKTDGVIFFSDILTPLPALGIEFDMVKGKGPVISNPVRRYGLQVAAQGVAATHQHAFRDLCMGGSMLHGYTSGSMLAINGWLHGALMCSVYDTAMPTEARPEASTWLHPLHAYVGLFGGQKCYFVTTLWYWEH